MWHEFQIYSDPSECHLPKESIFEAYLHPQHHSWLERVPPYPAISCNRDVCSWGALDHRVLKAKNG